METVIGLDLHLKFLYFGFVNHDVLSLIFIRLSALVHFCIALQMTGHLLGSYLVDDRFRNSWCNK